MAQAHQLYRILKKNSDSILKFVSISDKEEDSEKRKTINKLNFEDVDKTLYVWFSQKCLQGQPVSGPLLCEKALLFNEGLNGDASFKASSGWLRNNKLRDGIREIEVQVEKLSAPSVNAEKFISEFKKMTESKIMTRSSSIMLMKICSTGNSANPIREKPR